ALTRELAGIERKALRLHHLDRHGLELAQPRRAAKLAPAHADAAGDARLVARADLLHLDARPDGLTEIARQIAQLELVVGGDEDGGARPVERGLDLHELGREPARAHRAERGCAELALLLEVLVLAREFAGVGLLDD